MLRPTAVCRGQYKYSSAPLGTALAAKVSCAKTDHRKEWIRNRTSFCTSQMVVIDSKWSVPCPEMIFVSASMKMSGVKGAFVVSKKADFNPPRATSWGFDPPPGTTTRH
jgi:hypothetical protein